VTSATWVFSTERLRSVYNSTSAVISMLFEILATRPTFSTA